MGNGGNLLIMAKYYNTHYRLLMIEEIKMYCKELGMEFPTKDFPENMSNDEMEKWLETWDEYDPFPELN